MIDMEQLIQTKWCSRNKALYISKGYKYTKMGDIFYIRAKDLLLNSREKIKYTCDICGKEFETRYQNFNKHSSSLCKSCNNRITTEKNKVQFSNVKASFEAMGYLLKSTESDYKNNKSKLVYTCKKHGDFTTTYSHITKCHGCPKCALESNSGSTHYNYKGGITEITKYLRIQLSPWIQQQLQRTNYKCELTGKQGALNVHHMVSFSTILNKTMQELNMDIRPSYGDYSEEELQLITVNFLKNNELYAEPVVMLESVHRDFHKFCGGTSKETTYEQLREFKNQLLSA